MTDSARCPDCGRTIELFAHPDRGLVLMPHRVKPLKEQSAFNAPFCRGGGWPSNG